MRTYIEHRKWPLLGRAETVMPLRPRQRLQSTAFPIRTETA